MRAFVTLLFIGLSLGCDVNRGANAALTGPTAGLASRALTSTPSHPGNSGVFRFADTIGFFIYDFDHNLLSLHGSATLFTDICAGTTPPVFESVDFQVISTASGLQNLFADQDHPVQIYPAVPFGCPSLAVTPRLAAGSARIIRVDNDLFGDDRGTNSTGWQASGLLDDLAHGGTVRYSEVVRVLFFPDSSDVFERQVEIRLH